MGSGPFIEGNIMNPWLLSGGTLMIIVGMVHTVLGERLIFRRFRAGGLIPTDGGSLLLEPPCLMCTSAFLATPYSKVPIVWSTKKFIDSAASIPFT
jgi:hypothetical protein